MCKDLQGANRLIRDLKEENLLKDFELGDDVIKIFTPKILLLLYLPQSVRMDLKSELKVVHLDIDLLNNHYNKVFARLKGLLGKGKRIYARETVVARVDKKVALDFLEEYHLNDALSGKYRYGLYYKGELVSVAVFSGGRIMRNISAEYRSFELLRFCHKADYLVIGGISKLIKAFINEFKPNDIMTYADRDWSQQSSLESIGFRDEGVISEQVFRIKNGKRLSFDKQTENFDYIIKNMGSIKLKLYV